MIDDLTKTTEELIPQLDEIEKIKQLNFQNELPQGLISRKLTIKFNAFPTIQLYAGKSPHDEINRSYGRGRVFGGTRGLCN